MTNTSEFETTNSAGWPAEICLTPWLESSIYNGEHPQEAVQSLIPFTGDVKVKWHPGSIDIHFSQLSIGCIRTFYMTVGTAVDINCLEVPKRDFFSLTIPLTAKLEATIDNQPYRLLPTEIITFTAKENFFVNWESSIEVLTIHIPYSLLDQLILETCKTENITASQLDQGNILGGSYWPLLTYLLNQATYANSRPSQESFKQAWISHAEKSLALFALEHVFSYKDTDAKSEQKSAAEKRAYKTILKLEEYIHEHLEAPITLNDLLKQANCSRSRLFSICQEQLGLSPIGWLRSLRLDAARTYLLEHSDISIMAVAYRFGFGHSGRFSQYYAKKFKELPHVTRTNSYLP